MFGPRYFGHRYFGPRYWGDGGASTLAPDMEGIEYRLPTNRAHNIIPKSPAVYRMPASQPDYVVSDNE